MTYPVYPLKELRAMMVKKWGILLLGFLYLPGLVACSYLPKRRRKRTSQERVNHSIKQFDKDTERIKGKDDPGRLF
jgi:hypothetical protein